MPWWFTKLNHLFPIKQADFNTVLFGNYQAKQFMVYTRKCSFGPELCYQQQLLQKDGSLTEKVYMKKSLGDQQEHFSQDSSSNKSLFSQLWLNIILSLLVLNFNVLAHYINNLKMHNEVVTFLDMLVVVRCHTCSTLHWSSCTSVGWNYLVWLVCC